jgi:GntR family transcriptional regulator/MocR family aminotransferase
VTEAYEQLTAEGYLESTHGSGTYVCRQIPDELLRARRGPTSDGAGNVCIRMSRYGRRLSEDSIIHMSSLA